MRQRTLTTALTALIALTAAVAAGVAEPRATHAATLTDRFACYSGRFIGFQAQKRTLNDGLSGTVSVLVDLPERICAPVAAHSGGGDDATSYLTCYRVAARVAPRGTRTVALADPIATLSVSRTPTSHCVPAARIDTGGRAVSKALGLFDCYPATSTQQTRQETVADYFGESDDTLRQPLRLCAPSAKKGGPPAVDPQRFLLCSTTDSRTKGATVVVRTEFGYLKAALGPRESYCTRVALASLTP